MTIGEIIRRIKDSASPKTVQNIRIAALRACWAEGRAAQARMHARFEGERYATVAGTISRLGAFGRRWRRHKARHGLDPRRGHAGGGLARAIKSAAAFKPLPNGFAIDISTTAVTTRVPRVRGPARRVPVATYAKHYADSKAPGFPSLTIGDRRAISKAMRAAVGKRGLTALRGRSVTSGPTSVRVRIDMRLTKLL